ncbi:MAG: glutamate--tRNA ligase [Candidatus Sungbacteria bacterium]|uniref:Glutamate--tRNA ligase n=1 Tax=Candidatus Sungiibacteriota bacterium TaxID=2750080 RepID=A0A932YWN9_9BACT|nr:glutamate--tRNA ligase [Candidatus Sungbacteria bacterium]
MSSPTVRTRFAPSPTGPLHVGGARSALFNYLFARKHGGKYVLRIEDTDLERSDPEYEIDIFESFRWLGIHADESPEENGPYGPYRQTERIGAYRPYLERLISSGHAYYCPHTEEELEKEKKDLMASGKNPVHICSYRDNSAPADNKNGIIRFKTPPGRMLEFDDLIRGPISFRSDLLGDFSIAKNFETPLYNFAVAADDHDMEISHVIRGEEHISNTPKQMLIAEALGFTLPVFAHLPLILGSDRTKLSKRHGAASVREFRQDGYLPEALVNFMALLGWNPGHDREIFSLNELVEAFDISDVQKSGAVFNREKLDWMNGEYIRKKTVDELVPLARSFLPEFSDEKIASALLLEQPRLAKLSELPERASYLGEDPDYETSLLRWKDMSDKEIQESLEQAQKIIEDVPENSFTPKELEHRFLEAIGAGDKGKVLWPLRVALTGKRASPGPFDIMAVLGSEATRSRVQKALKKISRP